MDRGLDTPRTPTGSPCESDYGFPAFEDFRGGNVDDVRELENMMGLEDINMFRVINDVDDGFDGHHHADVCNDHVDGVDAIDELNMFDDPDTSVPFMVDNQVPQPPPAPASVDDQAPQPPSAPASVDNQAPQPPPAPASVDYRVPQPPPAPVSVDYRVPQPPSRDNILLEEEDEEEDERAPPLATYKLATPLDIVCAGTSFVRTEDFKEAYVEKSRGGDYKPCFLYEDDAGRTNKVYVPFTRVRHCVRVPSTSPLTMDRLSSIIESEQTAPPVDVLFPKAIKGKGVFFFTGRIVPDKCVVGMDESSSKAAVVEWNNTYKYVKGSSELVDNIDDTRSKKVGDPVLMDLSSVVLRAPPMSVDDPLFRWLSSAHASCIQQRRKRRNSSSHANQSNHTHSIHTNHTDQSGHSKRPRVAALSSRRTKTTDDIDDEELEKKEENEEVEEKDKADGKKEKDGQGRANIVEDRRGAGGGKAKDGEEGTSEETTETLKRRLENEKRAHRATAVRLGRIVSALKSLLE